MSPNRLVATAAAASLLFPAAACGREGEPRPGPDGFPSAAATTGSSPDAPNHGDLKGFAIGDGFFGLSEEELGKRLDKAKLLGNAIRLDLDWAQIQPTENGAYRWDETDRIVTAARARGLAVLAMVGFAPEWARDADCKGDYGCAPRDPREFARFAADAATRYGDKGITDYEVWNEPNVEQFFAPRPDVVRYAGMLTLAAKAIKEAVPRARIASGGLAAGYDEGTTIAPVTFLEQLYKAGAEGFTAVALHPYNSPAKPSQPYGWSAFTQIEGGPGVTDIPTIHGVMAAHGDAQKQVWLTEYGAPTHGAGNSATLGDQRFEDFDARPGAHVDEGLQAAMIGDFLRYPFQKAHVTVRMVHTLYDRRMPGESDNSEDYFGIYNADGTPKKAVTVFTAGG